MALINCAECHKEISDKAKQCPYCGCPTRTKKLSKKTKCVIGVTLLVALVISGVYCYNIEHARIIKAEREHNEFIEELSYPPRPNSYDELIFIMNNNSISQENFIALRAKFLSYQLDGVAFENTPIYRDWNRYRTYFTKIGEKP